MQIGDLWDTLLLSASLCVITWQWMLFTVMHFCVNYLSCMQTIKKETFMPVEKKKVYYNNKNVVGLLFV